MTLTWLFGLVAALVAVSVAIPILQRVRDRKLRGYFGPEYDHVLEGLGPRGAAERALIARAKRVEQARAERVEQARARRAEPARARFARQAAARRAAEPQPHGPVTAPR
jgi:hypothetical protein